MAKKWTEYVNWQHLVKLESQLSRQWSKTSVKETHQQMEVLEDGGSKHRVPSQNRRGEQKSLLDTSTASPYSWLPPPSQSLI